MGETVYISEYLKFGFFYHVSYKENSILGATYIDGCLVVSHIAGGLISYWPFTKNGKVIPRTTGKYSPT